MGGLFDFENSLDDEHVVTAHALCVLSITGILQSESQPVEYIEGLRTRNDLLLVESSNKQRKCANSTLPTTIQVHWCLLVGETSAELSTRVWPETYSVGIIAGCPVRS